MFAGRPVVITGGPVAGLVRLVPDVTELSGRRPFVLANGVGTGPVPDPDEAEMHLLPEGNATSVVGSTHEQLRILADLPADALVALDAWDPDGGRWCWRARSSPAARSAAAGHRRAAARVGGARGQDDRRRTVGRRRSAPCNRAGGGVDVRRIDCCSA